MRTQIQRLTLAATVAVACATAPAAFAADNPMVGGVPMYANKTIVENASTAQNLSTLVTAVKAAGLVDTLSGKGPFTVFAPDNQAFASGEASPTPTAGIGTRAEATMPVALAAGDFIYPVAVSSGVAVNITAVGSTGQGGYADSTLSIVPLGALYYTPA